MSPQPLRAELTKLRRAPIWIAYLVLPVIASAIGTFNYQQNLGILTPGWMNLWTQHTLFNLCFFLPALVSAGCSWLMGLEHTGTNWYHILTSPVAPWRIVASKIVVGEIMLAVSLFATGILFVIDGKLIGIGGLPSLDFCLYLFMSLVGGAAVVSTQLFISSFVRNFAAPVGIGLAGGIAGLLLTAKGIGQFWPWALLQLASNTSGQEGLVVGQLGAVVIASVLFTFVVSAACTYMLSRNTVC